MKKRAALREFGDSRRSRRRFPRGKNLVSRNSKVLSYGTNRVQGQGDQKEILRDIHDAGGPRKSPDKEGEPNIMAKREGRLSAAAGKHLRARAKAEEFRRGERLRKRGIDRRMEEKGGRPVQGLIGL